MARDHSMTFNAATEELDLGPRHSPKRAEISSRCSLGDVLSESQNSALSFSCGSTDGRLLRSRDCRAPDRGTSQCLPGISKPVYARFPRVVASMSRRIRRTTEGAWMKCCPLNFEAPQIVRSASSILCGEITKAGQTCSREIFFSPVKAGKPSCPRPQRSRS
jgi:hypothetical protein